VNGALRPTALGKGLIELNRLTRLLTMGIAFKILRSKELETTEI